MHNSSVSYPPRPNIPPKVDDYTDYWRSPPPKRSARCNFWLSRLRDGWVPPRRIMLMGYDEASEFYGVYVWEFEHVIFPVSQIRTLIAARTMQ